MIENKDVAVLKNNRVDVPVIMLNVLLNPHEEHPRA